MDTVKPCVYIHILISIHTVYTYMHACIHTYIDVCMHACMHACMYVCMYRFDTFSLR